MSAKLDLTGSGRYVVSVNGVDLAGEHNLEREAIQRGTTLALANPEDVVEYRNELKVRVRVTGAGPAPAPEPTPVPVPVPSADVLWRWDARSVAPFGIHAKDPSRVTLVTVGGRPAVRLQTLPGDTNVNGSKDAERCDLRLGNDLSDAKEGREWWFKHGVWFPNDYVDQPQSPLSGGWQWGSCMNWHDDADTGGTDPTYSQGPLQMMMMPKTAISSDRPTGLHFQIYGGTSGINRLGDFPVAPIVRNMWYDLEYHIRWTAGADGFAAGWVNGEQFMAHKGPTLHAGHGAYLKLANYHVPTGKPSALMQGAAVRARTRAALG